MWLESFKPKSGNVQNSGVPGVPCVPPPRKANAHAGVGGTPALNTEKDQRVPGVPPAQAGTPGTPRNTSPTIRCSGDQTPRKRSTHAGFGFAGTPGTPGTPQKHHIQEIDADTIKSLALFRFDLMQEAIDAGSSADELRRVNNMAWEFMQADSMGFDDAIRLAAEIVVHGHVAACEAAYVDVIALFEKVRQ